MTEDEGTAPPKVFRQARFQRPPGSTELVIVRHGESEPLVPGQPFPLVDGHGDPALAPEGRAQAECVGARLAGERIDAIYVTSLRRTAQTAAPLASRLGLVPSVEPDLREVHLGEWEGELFRQKMAQQDPVAVRVVQEERWDVIPGGEPEHAFRSRVRRGVERIAAAHPDQRVAVFTHGGVIGCIFSEATRASLFSFVGCDNGAISHVVVAGDRWIVRRFNDTTHLEHELTTEAEPLT